MGRECRVERTSDQSGAQMGDGPAEVLEYYALVGTIVELADPQEAISESARDVAIQRILDMSKGDANG